MKGEHKKTTIRKDNSLVTKNDAIIIGDFNNITGNNNVIHGDHCNIYGNNNSIRGDFNTIVGSDNNGIGGCNESRGHNNYIAGNFNNDKEQKCTENKLKDREDKEQKWIEDNLYLTKSKKQVPKYKIIVHDTDVYDIIFENGGFIKMDGYSSTINNVDGVSIINKKVFVNGIEISPNDSQDYK